MYLGTNEKIIHKIEKDVRKYCSWCGAKNGGLRMKYRKSPVVVEALQDCLKRYSKGGE